MNAFFPLEFRVIIKKVEDFARKKKIVYTRSEFIFF